MRKWEDIAFAFTMLFVVILCIQAVILTGWVIVKLIGGY